MNQNEVKNSTLLELRIEKNPGFYNVSGVVKSEISPDAEEGESSSMFQTTNTVDTAMKVHIEAQPEFVDITKLRAKRNIPLKVNYEIENFINTTETVKPQNLVATKLQRKCEPKGKWNPKSLCPICGTTVYNHNNGLESHINKHLGKTFELNLRVR